VTAAAAVNSGETMLLNLPEKGLARNSRFPHIPAALLM